MIQPPPLPASGPLSHSTTPAVEVIDLRVDYGDFTAVESLTFSVPSGEIYGLVGPNGAGKTSTFKVLATLMEPTYGDVFLCGIDIAEKRGRAREVLGYMPDLAPVPSDIQVWEFLDLFAAAYGVGEKDRPDRIDYSLRHVSLQDKRHDYCQNLSRGMKQRLALAKTLLHRPKVMLLDEPASGMDPISRAALRRTLQSLAKEGTTILVSSHIISELSVLCTSIGIMSKGKLIADGKVEDVIRSFSKGHSIALKVLDDPGPALAVLGSCAHVADVQTGTADGAILFHFHGDEDAQAELLAKLVTGGCRVRSFAERQLDLESILLGLDDSETRHGN